MDREPLLRAVPLDQARPMALRRPGHRRLPDTLVLDPHPPPPAGQGRRVPRRPGPGLLLAAAPTTPNATGHTDSTSTRALHPPTPTGTCLSRMRGRLARPVLRGPRLGNEPGLPDGAREEHGQQAKLVAVLDHAEHLALSQVQVVDGDELAAFVPVLDTLADLHGVVVTADALHCQRTHADYLHARGAHYLFTVKANQPTLRRALARLPWAQVPGLRERNVGHGRTESRSIKVIDLASTPEGSLFPHGAQAIKVVRRRRAAGRAKASVETVYAITSLGHRDADPRLLAGWIRSHWTIENCLHWVRDVTEGEDHSSVRTGHGPQVMAALRNTAINIIRLRGETNIAAAHRAFSYRPADVLAALTAA